MIKLSGVVITYNEERSIEKCLQSLKSVADEIVVVDSYSTDSTKSICAKYGVTFIEQKFLGYVEQKNFALKQASYDHIVSLDGDEALSERLQQSIKALKYNGIDCFFPFGLRIVLPMPNDFNHGKHNPFQHKDLHRR